MKATGVVRKIDDLGRVTLPMELRRTIGIDTKDPLEIFTDGDSIILRPYRRDTEKTELIEQLKKVKILTEHSSVYEIMDQTIEFIKKKA